MKYHWGVVKGDLSHCWGTGISSPTRQRNKLRTRIAWPWVESTKWLSRRRKRLFRIGEKVQDGWRLVENSSNMNIRGMTTGSSSACAITRTGVIQSAFHFLFYFCLSLLLLSLQHDRGWSLKPSSSHFLSMTTTLQWIFVFLWSDHHVRLP